VQRAIGPLHTASCGKTQKMSVNKSSITGPFCTFITLPGRVAGGPPCVSQIHRPSRGTRGEQDLFCAVSTQALDSLPAFTSSYQGPRLIGCDGGDGSDVGPSVAAVAERSSPRRAWSFRPPLLTARQFANEAVRHKVITISVFAQCQVARPAIVLPLYQGFTCSRIPL